MSKKIIGIILALLVIGGAVYAYKNTSNKQVSMSSDDSQSEMMANASKFSEMIASGKPVNCTLTKGDDKIEYLVQGEMFKMTSHISPADGEPTPPVGHALSDGTYVYSWSEDSDQGVKMKMQTDEEIADSTQQAQDYENQKPPTLSSQEDYDTYKNEGYEVNCQTVAESEATFTPPTDINFFDPTEMSKTIMPDGENLNMDKLKELEEKYGQME